MWVEFVDGRHLVLSLFLQVLWFFNLTTIEHQLRLMWVEFVVGPCSEAFSPDSLVFQLNYKRASAKTDMG